MSANSPMTLRQALAIHDEWGAGFKAFEELLSVAAGQGADTDENLKQDIRKRMHTVGGEKSAAELERAHEFLAAAEEILRERGTADLLRDHLDDAELAAEAARTVERRRH